MGHDTPETNHRLLRRAAILICAIGGVIFLALLSAWLQDHPDTAFAVTFTTGLTVPLLAALAVGERRRATCGGAR